MKNFNKLVRDKIPEIIEKNNETCEIRILEDSEYLEELNKKIQEEMKEYLESGEIEELADLEEVLRAILNVKNCSYQEFEKLRKDKVLKRGAFDKKIFLISTDEMEKKRRKIWLLRLFFLLKNIIFDEFLNFYDYFFYFFYIFRHCWSSSC